jgi:hypothetical protein
LAEVFRGLPQRRRGRKVDLVYLDWNDVLLEAFFILSPTKLQTLTHKALIKRSWWSEGGTPALSQFNGDLRKLMRVLFHENLLST